MADAVSKRARERWAHAAQGGVSAGVPRPAGASPDDAKPEADGYFVARGDTVATFGPHGLPLVMTARMREGDTTVVLLFEEHEDQLVMTMRGRQRQVLRFARDPRTTAEQDAWIIIDLFADAGGGAVIIATETAKDLEQKLRGSALLRNTNRPTRRRLRVALGRRMHWIKGATR